MSAPRILFILPSFIKFNHYYCQYYHHFHFMLYFLTKETSKGLVEPNSLTLSPWVNLSPNLFLRNTFGCTPRFFLPGQQSASRQRFKWRAVLFLFWSLKTSMPIKKDQLVYCNTVGVPTYDFKSGFLSEGSFFSKRTLVIEVVCQHGGCSIVSQGGSLVPKGRL